MSLDLGPPLRKALIAADGIGGELGKWCEEPAVFTRRPVPDDAPDLLIIVNPNAALGNEDAINSERPVVVRDIAIYGKKGEPGTSSDQTWIVDALGYRVRELFHSKKFSVSPEGYSVIDVVAAGPVPAPVDDDETVGRLVSLTIRLRKEVQ